MGNFTLGRYIPMDSIVHRMDPRAKIGAMLILLVAIFFPAGWIGYACIFAAVSIVILMAKLSFLYIWKSMRPMLVMLVFLLVMNVLVVKTGTILITIGTFSVYSGAVFRTL